MAEVNSKIDGVEATLSSLGGTIIAEIAAILAKKESWRSQSLCLRLS